MTTTLAIVSDIHANSTVAVCPASVNLDDGGTYRPSKAQRWIRRQWLSYWQEVAEERERAGGRLVVVLNGELADNNYHPTTQLVSRNPSDLIRLAIDTLQPMLDLNPDAIYVTRGTEAHSGQSSHLDEEIANDISAVPADEDGEIYSHWHLKLQVERVRFDIAHHPPGGGGRVPWTRQGFADKLAAVTMFEYAERHEFHPHLLIRGHVHRPSDSYDKYPVRALVLPSWQLTTAYGHRIGGDPLPIGGVIVSVDGDRATVAKHYRHWPTEGYRRA